MVRGHGPRPSHIGSFVVERSVLAAIVVRSVCPTTGGRVSWIARTVVGAVILGASVAGSLFLIGRPDASDDPVQGEIIEAGAPPGLRRGPDAGAGDAGGLPLPHPLTAALCPPGMNWVEGEYCPGRARRPKRCAVAIRNLGFCMDVFEYPNQRGVVPAVLVPYYEAQNACEAEGKRLCTEAEFALACGVPKMLEACNFGRTDKTVLASRFWKRERVAEELVRVDARRPSEPSDCVSAHGVFDLLGNVQEWVSSDHPSGYGGAIKGGGYNESSIDCERSIQTRLVDVGYPNTGFRCCADPLVEPPSDK